MKKVIFIFVGKNKDLKLEKLIVKGVAYNDKK